jgi:RimJ/RimL family protein N-acetyltransferase
LGLATAEAPAGWYARFATGWSTDKRPAKRPDEVGDRDTGALLGYGTLGSEARVPGGAYTDDPGVLDIGLGLRPDLVGRGLGAHALSAVIANVRARLPIRQVRATIASVNLRATALVQRLGFTATHRFRRPSDGREFVQYEREVGRDVHG